MTGPTALTDPATGTSGRDVPSVDLPSVDVPSVYVRTEAGLLAGVVVDGDVAVVSADLAARDIGLGDWLEGWDDGLPASLLATAAERRLGLDPVRPGPERPWALVRFVDEVYADQEWDAAGARVVYRDWSLRRADLDTGAGGPADEADWREWLAGALADLARLGPRGAAACHADMRRFVRDYAPDELVSEFLAALAARASA